MASKNPVLTVSKPSLMQTLLRLLLGAALLFAGISHLTFARAEFLAQVPPWLPLDGDFVVVASGIVEIVLGLALIYPGKYRVWVGWIAAAFFVAVFPGNISQYVNGIDGFGLNTDEARLTRLFFQPVLVIWALWSTGAWQAWWARQTQKSLSAR
ncbi:MAG: DoxX family membrane protein [Chloroflexi bacterium]|nr:DoxX family membrane protein [Chloroflexota bacterium]